MKAHKTVADKCRSGYKRSRRGIVYFITADKNIQAFKTAAAWGVMSTLVMAIAEILKPIIDIIIAWFLRTTIGFSIYTPLSLIAFFLMILVFYVFDYADENTEEWKNMVEEATGEEAAEGDESENIE